MFHKDIKRKLEKLQKQMDVMSNDILPVCVPRKDSPLKKYVKIP